MEEIIEAIKEIIDTHEANLILSDLTDKQKIQNSEHLINHIKQMVNLIK